MIIAIEVTILAHSLRIYHLILVRAVGGKGTPSIEVITMITHTLGIVFHVSMWAPCHLFFRAGLLNNLLYYCRVRIYRICPHSFENGPNSILLLSTESQIMRQLLLVIFKLLVNGLSHSQNFFRRTTGFGRQGLENRLGLLFNPQLFWTEGLFREVYFLGLLGSDGSW